MMNRAALGLLDLQPGERLLEIGFGGGDLLGLALKNGVQEVVGIEISDALLAHARRRFKHEVETGRLRLLAASAEALPPDLGGFEKVASVNTVYFWSRPGDVLAGFARALRPGGRLVLAFQTPESVRRWPGHVHGFHVYGAEEIAALMAAAGFNPPSVTAGSDPRIGDFLCLTSERK